MTKSDFHANVTNAALFISSVLPRFEPRSFALDLPGDCRTLGHRSEKGFRACVKRPARPVQCKLSARTRLPSTDPDAVVPSRLRSA